MAVVGVLVDNVLLEVVLDHVPDCLDELASDFEAGCSSPRLFCLQCSEAVFQSSCCSRSSPSSKIL